MSPRRNRRSADVASDPDKLGTGGYGRERVDTGPDGEWVVRPITGAGAAKSYRCPGCDQEITPGVPHVVAWPAAGSPDDRRHWHTACWNARHHRHRGGRGTRSRGSG